MKRKTWTRLGTVGVAFSLFGAGCGEKSFLGDSQQSSQLDDPQAEGGGPSSPDDTPAPNHTAEPDAGAGGTPPEAPSGEKPAVAPCAGKACGEACATPCPSGQTCAAVVSFCDEDGHCSVNKPTCDSPAPDPECAGKYCGDVCGGACAGDNCFISFCNDEGKCSSQEPACSMQAPPWECRGKACGEYCRPVPTLPCRAGDPDCVEPVFEPCFCDSDGQVSRKIPMCEELPCEKDCPPVPPVCHQCNDGQCAAPVIIACNPGCVLGEEWVCADGTRQPGSL